MSLGTTSNTCQIVYLSLLMIIISASNNSTQTVNCASPVYVWALECPQSHPRPSHDQYWLGGQGTADQRPLSFFVAEFGPTWLANGHDKWFLTFSKFSTKSLDLFITMFNKLTFSSRVSSRMRHRLQIFQEIYVVTFSNPGVHRVPKIYKENHFCQRHNRPQSFAKVSANSHPTTGSRFKALTKQIRSAS